MCKVIDMFDERNIDCSSWIVWIDLCQNWIMPGLRECRVLALFYDARVLLWRPPGIIHIWNFNYYSVLEKLRRIHRYDIGIRPIDVVNLRICVSGVSLRKPRNKSNVQFDGWLCVFVWQKSRCQSCENQVANDSVSLPWLRVRVCVCDLIRSCMLSVCLFVCTATIIGDLKVLIRWLRFLSSCLQVL